jgi:pSer/pThr/pTyr-binding forkhead associated (FHA) protein
MSGKMEGQRLEISEGQPVVIGRDPSCDLVLSDDLASRQHARVRRDFSGTHIEDLGSRNGIKVNKKRVKSRTLKDRDEVEVGGTRFLFLDPTEVREAAVLEPEPSMEMTSPPQPKEPEPEPEPPPPEPEPEPPPPEPEPEPEAPPEEPPAEEAPPEEAPAGGGGKMPAIVGLVLMGVLGLVVIGFIFALLVGA